jgi:hypothetical protein
MTTIKTPISLRDPITRKKEAGRGKTIGSATWMTGHKVPNVMTKKRGRETIMMILLFPPHHLLHLLKEIAITEATITMVDATIRQGGIATTKMMIPPLTARALSRQNQPISPVPERQITAVMVPTIRDLAAGIEDVEGNAGATLGAGHHPDTRACHLGGRGEMDCLEEATKIGLLTSWARTPQLGTKTKFMT